MDHLCVGYLSPPPIDICACDYYEWTRVRGTYPPPPLGSLVSYCGVSHFALPRLAHTLENGTWEMRLELTATSPCYLVGTLTSARKGRKIILASPIYNRCILWGCTPVWIRTLFCNTLIRTTLRISTYQDVFNSYLFAVIWSEVATSPSTLKEQERGMKSRNARTHWGTWRS